MDMETQLIRLDAPYKVICNPRGEFGLQIGTLIVVDEEEETDSDGNTEKYKVARSYPVIDHEYGAGGNVWMAWEVDECKYVCRQGEKSFTLRDVDQMMHYFYEKGVINLPGVPVRLGSALAQSGVKVNMPTDKSGKPIHDFEVELAFVEERGSIMIYSQPDSPFFFVGSYKKHDDDLLTEYGKDDALQALAEMRDLYIAGFHADGVNSIKFTTADEEHESFVSLLNRTPSVYNVE